MSTIPYAGLPAPPPTTQGTPAAPKTSRVSFAHQAEDALNLSSQAERVGMPLRITLKDRALAGIKHMLSAPSLKANIKWSLIGAAALFWLPGSQFLQIPFTMAFIGAIDFIMGALRPQNILKKFAQAVT